MRSRGQAAGSSANVRAPVRPCLLAACLVLVSGCATSLARPLLCGAEASCPPSRVCVAARCEVPSRPLASADSVRILLAPSKLAVIASGGGGGAPDTVTLGRAGAGEVIVLLGFEPPFRDDAVIERAYLLLTPAEHAPPSRTKTELELARILTPWDGAETTWGRQPRLSASVPVATLAPGSRAQARVDVTDLVRTWPKRPGSARDLALVVGRGTDTHGAAFAMGLSTGVGPRLEVYLR